MSIVLDLPLGLEELDKVFEVSELLDNKDELIQSFKPSVSKFLVKKDFFPPGPFRKSYEMAFDELIASLIKKEIIKHFPSYTPEEVLLLTDLTFLKLIGNELFDPENYSKEGIKHE